jgi:hypothetical protein
MASNKYNPNEPEWITIVREAIADRFQLRQERGTYNPIRSRPVGGHHGMSDREWQELPYWEIGVPYVFESSGMNELVRVTEFIASLEHVNIESNCEGWSDVDHRTGRRRNAAGARFMLWFELSVA